MTPFNQFKYSTFAPFSLLTPTQLTTKYPTATAQFVNYYTTSTTRQPFISTTLQPIEKPATISNYLAYASTQLTTRRVIAPIATKIANNHSIAVIRSSFFTTTTPKPSVALLNLNNIFTTSTEASKVTATSKFNLFDLYLGRTSTKKPKRYNIPTFAPLPKQPIMHLSPYTTHTTRATPFLNTYSIPDIFKPKTTTVKPAAGQAQRLLQAQASSIALSLGIKNSTFLQPYSAATSPKPRIYHYSFSGTKAPTLN